MKTRTGKLSRVFSIVLAMIMMLSFATTAFAATTPASYSDKANLTIAKKLTTETAGVFPSVTDFQFTLTPFAYNGGPAGGTAYNAANLPMPGGSVGAATFTVGGFSPSAAGLEQTKETTTQNITYTQTGIYTYKLKEVIPTDKVQGVTYDEKEYYINVYVTNVLNEDGTPLISNGKPVVNVSAITTWEGGNTPTIDPTQPDNPDSDAKKTGIVTPPATNGDPRNVKYPFENAYATASLTVIKKVTGNLAETARDFDFTLGLKTADGSADVRSFTYKVYNFGADGVKGGTDDQEQSGTGKAGTITNGASFKLKHNEYVVVIGLPDGEKVTVTETGADDYTTTVAAVHGDVTDNATTARKTAGEKIIATGTDKVNQQTFTNAKNSTPPTGVMLDVLPFALMFVLAIFGATLLLKKKAISGR